MEEQIKKMEEQISTLEAQISNLKWEAKHKDAKISALNSHIETYERHLFGEAL